MGYRRGIAVALVMSGCGYGGGAFVCANDGQCGVGGKCETDGFCAFADGACTSGYRYGGVSGPSSNQCVVGGSQLDGGGDAHVFTDAPPGELCYGTGVVSACFAQPPTNARVFATTTAIDTDDTAMCDPILNSTAWCVIAGSSITIASGVTVTATGSRPLVLVATGTIMTAGTIDVASHRTPTESFGAGSDPSTCNPGTAPGANGGGAGGSFGGKGGDGGDPNKGTASPASAVPTTLRGGCRGQDGMSGATIAVGGHGGGAVLLYAGTSITIAGAVDASGESGTVGAPSDAGGSGGGAGGMIVFESPMVTVTSMVFANGGGAASGTGGSTAGSSGTDPVGVQPAPGGSGPTTHGGPGGAGSAGAPLGGVNGTAGNTGGGGGGGGGGAGVIWVRPTQATGSGAISPPAS